MKITGLREKLQRVPRNEQGDPAFTKLGVELNHEPSMEDVIGVFTYEEIVELVNRSLYQIEYQQKSHAKYNVEKRLLDQLYRKAFHELYPRESYAKATNNQLAKCAEYVKQQRV